MYRPSDGVLAAIRRSGDDGIGVEVALNVQTIAYGNAKRIVVAEQQLRCLRNVTCTINIQSLAIIGVVCNNHVAGNVACNGSRCVGSAQINGAHAGACTLFKILRCGTIAEVQHNKVANTSQCRMNGIRIAYAQCGHIVLKKQLFRACTIAVFNLWRYLFHNRIGGFCGSVIGSNGKLERRVEIVRLRRVGTDCGVRRERHFSRCSA